MDTVALLADLKSLPHIRMEPPVSDEAVEIFIDRFGKVIDTQLLDVWKDFDGFDNSAGLIVRLWPLKEIAEYSDSREIPAGYCAFADELIWCEAYFFSPYDLSKPILLCYNNSFQEAEVVANSFWDFLRQVADGLR
jgi:hypothetical protein